MKTALLALIIIAAGTLLGAWSARETLEAGFGSSAMVDGPWSAAPQMGTTSGTPYDTARWAKAERIGFSGSETLELYATTDSRGMPLDPACAYRIEIGALPTKKWTLRVDDLAGAEVPYRRSFTSGNVVRALDGTATVRLGPELAPDNWLRTSGAYTLVLGLYETTLLSGLTQSRQPLPAITIQGCAS